MIYAHKTDIGAYNQAYCMMNGLMFSITKFSVGDGGINENTGEPLTVDRSLSELPSNLYTGTDIVLMNKSGNSFSAVCTVPEGEIQDNTDLSNMGLYAETEKGEFLYAVANFARMETAHGLTRLYLSIVS